MKSFVKNLMLIIIGIILVFLANKIDQTDSSLGLVSSVFLIPFIIGVIFYPIYRQTYIGATVCSCTLILLNDYLIRTSGRPADSEGGSVIAFIFMLVLFISVVLMGIIAYKTSEATETQSKKRTAFEKSFIAVIVAALTYAIYMTFFLRIGVHTTC